MEVERKRNRSMSSEGFAEEGTGENGNVRTLPKKPGRPRNPNKVEKVPSGRGRGRPKKSGTQKVSHPIEATGKGRGRPKNSTKIASDDYVPKGLPKKSKKTKPLGRPRKEIRSDEENGSDDKDDEEKRPVGRPSTGSAKPLNIVRTGRGQGRPKKAVAAKRAADVANGVVPKKRGRPSTGKTVPYVPTGRHRGRPRSNANDNKPNAEDSDNNPNEDDAEESDGEKFMNAENKPDVEDKDDFVDDESED